MKLITILDCYIHDDSILKKLENFIDLLKSKGRTILLLSNSKTPISIQNKVDYFFYDSNNPMFSEDWKFLDDYILVSDMGNFSIEDFYPRIQPHGLSVMINLYRGIQIAKSLGFTHFEKLEYDPIFDEDSLSQITQLPNKCMISNKKSLFFINNNTIPEDISFHYFFSEIDFFLNNTSIIKSETDYRNVILKNYNNEAVFICVERFLYDLISRIDSSLIYYITEEERDLVFKNVYWNSEISKNNLPKKYKNCGTKIYKILNKDGYYDDSHLIVLSYNLSNENVVRKIDCHFNDGVIYTIYHEISCKNCYSYHSLTPNLTHIDVYENDILLYTEHIQDCRNNLKYK